MKGLLIKDFYMAKAYGKIFLIFILISMVTICSGQENWIVVYSLLMVGIFPMTLQSYDERERWDKTCMLLPVSRTQIVSGKYLFGAILSISVMLLYSLLYGVTMLANHQFALGNIIEKLMMMLLFGLLEPAFVLPFVFKFGMEKGRIAYIASFAALFGGIAVITNHQSLLVAFPKIGRYGILAIVLLAYAVSWILSIHFYRKREL